MKSGGRACVAGCGFSSREGGRPGCESETPLPFLFYQSIYRAFLRDIWRKRAGISQRERTSESVAREQKKTYGHTVHTHFVLCKLHELIRNLKTVQNLSCKHLIFTYQ